MGKYKTMAKAGYLITVAIRYKFIRQTIRECNERNEPWGRYIHAQSEPHFPVPAIRTGVYVDDSMVYISDGHRLTTFYREGYNVQTDSYLY